MTKTNENLKQLVNESRNDQQRLNSDDEIDLFDLIDDIWKNKVWVLIGLVFILMLAGFYLFKTTPIYEAEAKVKSATANDLIEFSRPQLIGVFSLDIGGAFASAQSALLSTGYLKEFYKLNLEKIKLVPGAFDEVLSLEQNFTDFKRSFSIKTSSSKDAESYVVVSAESSDPVMVSSLVNDFVEYALFRRLRDTYDTMLVRVEGKIESLNYQANIKREDYLGDKARRILELKEASVIAVAVGQIKPVYRNMDLMGGQRPPLYMLGSKAINAEIKALEQREEVAKKLPRREDHFIEGLPAILLEIEELQKLQVDFSKIHLARVDEVAIAPTKPIKPRKLLIMALALVAGAFIGLFMALIAAAYNKHKIRIAAKQK